MLTKKDYFDFSGIDLDIELQKSNTDNPTKAVEIFIKRIEDRCLTFLQLTYGTNTINEEFFKKGVLHQIDYTRLNGDTPDISPEALRYFKLGGMCKIHQSRNRGYTQWL